MKKAVIYARFSTDLQNERSIEDQVTLCRDYTSREGMNVVEVYEDKARSGGSVMGRGGLLRLLDQAREQSFDVVVVEALDRLSRDMEDLAGIHKRLSFLGIEIRAVHEGVVNTVLVGLRGLVGQLYREDNAHKVRRGLAGRVGQGLNAGGRAYGYVPVLGDKGKRVISLHPAVLARYQEQLDELQDALSKGINAGDSDAAEAIRCLVETVTVFRDPSRPMVAGERFIRSPPSISAFSPSAALLAEATRRLAGYAHNYPGLRRFAAGP
jgi:DNA invertase Pin-like site-specific DNA recombinase